MNRQKKILLLIFDILLLILCLATIAYWRDEVPTIKVFNSLGTWFIAASVALLYYIFGAYDISAVVSTRRIFARTVLSLSFALSFIVLINYFGGKERSGVFGRGVLVGSFLIFGLLSSCVRLRMVSFLKKVVKKARWLFVCNQQTYQFLKTDLAKNNFQGQRFFLLDEVQSEKEDSVLGTWDRFPEVINNSWSHIIVSLDETAPKNLIEKLISARFENISVRDLIQFYEHQWRKVPLYVLGTNWFLHTEGFHLFGNPVRVRLKRIIDITTSFILLILTWPIMFFAWLAIRLESRGPAIYRQIRTGRDGKEFTLLKFRSMRMDAEAAGAQWAVQNDSRITKVGNFIRKTRIDELPQLLNILEGSMSLVGPRPERPEFNKMLKEKIPFYHFRHLVHPGLTGWAQVLYPYGASIEDAEEKLQYELYYIKNYSLWFDVSIILKTVQVVLFGKGR